MLEMLIGLPVVLPLKEELLLYPLTLYRTLIQGAVHTEGFSSETTSLMIDAVSNSTRDHTNRGGRTSVDGVNSNR